MSRDEGVNNPDVIADPKFIGLALIGLGLLLDYLKPLGLVVALSLLFRIVIGSCLLALGGSMAVRARATFFAVGTSDHPMHAALAMITTGIFSHVRNPMYQGGTPLLIGLALILGSDWMVIVVVPALILLHFGVSSGGALPWEEV
jgi:protein-S-isoprenylcysteine O-methyltransferase Ste14